MFPKDFINQKQLWDELARENSKYYINSDKGRGITGEEFRDSGLDDYVKYILEDNLIMDELKFSSDSVTIVDLGCGIGRMTEFMADDFDKVIGIDISKEMVYQAKKRVEGLSNVKFLESDGEKILLRDDSVNIVFSYLVFQHIKSREMVENNFKEVYRILKPKGLFKVLIRSDKVDINKWWGGVDYNEQSIGRLIKKVGFDLLKTDARDEYGFWLWLEK